MCIKCESNALINNRIKHNNNSPQRQFWTNFALGVAGGALNTFVGIGVDALQQALSGGGASDVSYVPPQNTEVVTTEAAEENPDEIEAETDPLQLEQEVKTILGEKVYDKLDSDMQSDILNKYNVYKTVLKLEGEELDTRVKTYVQALKANQIELKMGEYYSKLFQETLNEIAKDPKNPTLEELEQTKAAVQKKKQACDIKIVDSDIEQVLTGTDDQVYYGSLQNRGQGYVDMYDTNNDQIVSFEEFLAKEEKDNRITLKDEEKDVVQQIFNKIDKNGNGIDVNEMASHLYTVSRIHDNGDGPNTVADITFGEWADSQHMIDKDSGVSQRYDNIYKQLYNELNK